MNTFNEIEELQASGGEQFIQIQNEDTLRGIVFVWWAKHYDSHWKINRGRKQS